MKLRLHNYVTFDISNWILKWEGKSNVLFWHLFERDRWVFKELQTWNFLKFNFPWMSFIQYLAENNSNLRLDFLLISEYFPSNFLIKSITVLNINKLPAPGRLIKHFVIFLLLCKLSPMNILDFHFNKSLFQKKT